ncbi:hypothetical protein D918_01934 [Trichuris suis]|nr:hypothetical protein D918_01934 [Trichuris suis]
MRMLRAVLRVKVDAMLQAFGKFIVTYRNSMIDHTSGDEARDGTWIPEVRASRKGAFPGVSFSAAQTMLLGNILSRNSRLIRDRANGTLWTLARWMREFVQHHPDYKKDSIVSDNICYDMLNRMHGIQTGTVKCHELLGQFSCTSCRWTCEKQV